jgi:hypothetical protein
MDMSIDADEVRPEVDIPTASSSGGPTRKPRKTAPVKRKKKIEKPEKAAKAPGARTRENSQVAFPWYDLDTAISVARAIIEGGGLPVTRDQLAGSLRIAPTGGNFMLKTGSARIFGLLELVQGKFQLTQLGFSILDKDEAKEKAAKAEAFLNVPLYRRVYDEFRGKALPPRPHGLESAFIQFGVPTKSRKIARQVFDRSGRQAGFFNVDPDRLIEPIIGPGGAIERQSPDMGMEASSRAYSAPQQITSPTGSFELDELVRGLLRRLPKPGEKWSAERKAKWLNTLSQNLDYVVELEGDKIVVVGTKDANE